MNKDSYRLFLALGTALLLVLTCCTKTDDYTAKWSELLRGEDFGTGLLSTDIEKPQQELFREWALLRGFQFDEDEVSSREDSWSWNYTRQDEVRVSYEYALGWRGPIHNIIIQRYSVPVVEPVRKIEGVPPELTLGTSIQDVVAKWGLGSEFNRNEMKNRKRNEGSSLNLLYSVEFQEYVTYLTVYFWQDAVRCISLGIEPIGVAPPGSRPTTTAQERKDSTGD